jgi:hypothetical protein
VRVSFFDEMTDLFDKKYFIKWKFENAVFQKIPVPGLIRIVRIFYHPVVAGQ